MIETLQYIFSSVWVFFGFLTLVCVTWLIPVIFALSVAYNIVRNYLERKYPRK